MKASEIQLFREKLKLDEDNNKYRQTLHEQYEWLEAYWDDKYNSNQLKQFSHDFGEFFWNRPELKEIARHFSVLNPVGSSTRNFNPSDTVLRATYFLKYSSQLNIISPIENELEIKSANKWSSNGLNALLIIIEQIRNNLFHGKKMEIEEPQYGRNKLLVRLAAEATTLLLDNLEEAEVATIA